MLTILFTGGGTGGHIYPIIAVARELRSLSQKNNVPLKMAFAGPTDFNVERIAQEGITVYRIPAGKLRRYASWKMPWDIIKAFVGFFYALFLVWWIMPNAIFAKGGYGSINIGLVGRFYGIPLMVHDSDSAPGLVNRILGKIASRVAISFPGAASFFSGGKTAFLGNPVRANLLQGSKEHATSSFALQADRTLLLVMGGSQGSTRINEMIAATLNDLLPTYEIIHQVGSDNALEYEKQIKEVYGVDDQRMKYYHVKGYLSEQEEADALAAADIVISRAGSGSIYEIASMGKPSILIPLAEAAYDHQRLNAFYYARTGAAIIIEEANMSPHILLSEIKGVGESKNRQMDMSKAAKAFAKPDAAQKIAQGLLELAYG